MSTELSGKSPPHDEKQSDLPKPLASGKQLVDALSNSPLRDVPIKRVSVRLQARAVKL